MALWSVGQWDEEAWNWSWMRGVSEWTGQGGHWPACEDVGSAQSRPSTNLLILTRPLLLAVVCLPSSSSTGQSSCCIGGAGFPGIVGQLFLLCFLPLAQSFAYLTAQLQDSRDWEDLCHSDAFLYRMSEFCAVALVVGMFLWLRSEVFLQQKCLGSAMLGEIHRWVK